MDREAEWATVGKNIRTLRLKRGLTQEMLAEEAELSSPYLSYLESGRKKASLDALIRIAAVLQVTVDRLLGEVQGTVLEACVPEILALLQDCSVPERRAILEASKAIKQVIRDNRIN